MAKKKTAADKPSLFKGRNLREVIGPTRYFIDTGNLATNWICSGKFIGGGVPGCKMIEIFGPPSSAKSLWAYTLLGAIQKMGGIAVLIDCERAANPDFVETAGHCNIDELLYPAEMPVTLEDVELFIINQTKKIHAEFPDKPILFVWDSIGVNPCNREWKEIELPEGYTKEQFKAIVGSLERPGERARASGDVLRKLNPFIAENNVTLFIVNQTRKKIGAMPWEDDEIRAGGGCALPFYASLCLRTYAGKAFEDTKLKIPLGVNLNVQNKKNRTHVPFLKTTGVQLYFTKGINPLGGLLSTLINSGRVEKVSDGNYKVLSQWGGGEEVKFKSSEKRNDVPADLLLKCPLLIDAQSADEVNEYLGVFAEAIKLTDSEDTAEVDIKDPNADVLGIVIEE